MKKQIRRNLLSTLKSAGLFGRVLNSRWRQRRLLILCYHSFALDEENLWRPALYLTPQRLRERFEMLKCGGYNVLSVADGLDRLRSGNLPPRSVTLTFDDGTYDFYKLAYPLLKEYGFPATVYQTTHYCSRPLPIYSLMCSYLLWKKRESTLKAEPSIGIANDVSLNTAEARQDALTQIIAFANRGQLSTEQKNELAAELAQKLGIDYADLIGRRVLQLMTHDEIVELSRAGIDFELHTHRHRTPRDRVLFEKEIRDNRDALAAITNNNPVHFCYPSGDYDLIFLPWLAEMGVVSATTCDPELASTRSNPLLLPRFIDTTAQTPLEFEGWLTGVAALLTRGADAARFRTFSR